jgi:hypothetical protein
MKKTSKLLVLSVLSAWMITSTGCKKEAEIPALITTPVSDITPVSGISGGSVTSIGSSEVTARGICWSITNNPAIDSAKTTIGSGPGTFSSHMTGLKSSTTYYVRAYATNSAGTAYGNEISFSTLDAPPMDVTTYPITFISPYSAQSGGYVLKSGNGTLIETGICWNTSPNPTTASSKKINETHELDFSCDLQGLNPSTTYYVRAYAIYDTGTIVYGNEISFTTTGE